MGRNIETINFNNISEDDIIRFNAEIRKYNQEHEGSNSLDNVTGDIRYQLMQISSYLLQRAERLQKGITSDLYDILGSDGYFVELDHCIKRKDRLEEKIYKRAKEKNQDLMVAGNKIGDVLRYTIIFDDENYVTKVDNYLEELEDLDYQVIRFKNRWAEPYYKGINVQIKGPNDIIFEIQFHTKENHDIKEVFSRDPYKITRSDDSPIDLRVKAYYLRSYYQNKVHVPQFAIDYQYNSKKSKSL